MTEKYHILEIILMNMFAVNRRVLLAVFMTAFVILGCNDKESASQPEGFPKTDVADKNSAGSAGETGKNGQIEREIKRLKDILAKNPIRLEARHQLGVLLMMKGEHQKAIEEFLGVLALTPDNVNALQSIGMAYFKMGKKNKALFYWRSILDIQPDNKMIWALIDKVDDKAEESSLKEKGTEREKQRPSLEKWAEYYKKGQESYQKGDYEAAIKEFGIALENNPSDSRTHFSIGVVYNAMNKMEEAVSAWKESLKKQPDDLMIMKLITMGKKKIERKSGILKAKEGVRLTPEKAGAHFLLGTLYIADKHRRFINEAEVEFKETVRLDPNHSEAYEHLSEISFFRNEYSEGIRYLERAVAHLKEDNVLWKRIKAMKLYQALYEKGKKQWDEKGVKPFDEMVLIPGSDFVMGSEENDPLADKNEMPAIKVKLESFSIDKYEVTNSQYKRFLKRFSNYKPPKNWPKGKVPKDKENHPVVNIDWYMASAYCKSEGKRLPSEQEWEKAARGTEGAVFPWGDEFNIEYANGKESYFRRLTPAGSFEKGVTPYGVYDMAGNVSEWTSSGFKKGEEIGDKKFPFPQEKYKIRRGGSFLSYHNELRGASRVFAFPNHTDRDVGFRCVKD